MSPRGPALTGTLPSSTRTNCPFCGKTPPQSSGEHGPHPHGTRTGRAPNRTPRHRRDHHTCATIQRHHALQLSDNGRPRVARQAHPPSTATRLQAKQRTHRRQRRRGETRTLPQACHDHSHATLTPDSTRKRPPSTRRPPSQSPATKPYVGPACQRSLPPYPKT